METDDRFPTKLPSIQDAPEPLKSVLLDSISQQESIRLLIHAPSFSTLNVRMPATVLAVTDKGWRIVSETEDGGAHVEKLAFGDTLFLELASLHLSNQLTIHFAKVGTSYSVTTSYAAVGDSLYREAIEAILDGINPNSPHKADNNSELDKVFESWPTQLRTHAERYRPKDQPLLAAIQWPAIAGGYKRELCCAGALLITSREIVLISEEKTVQRQQVGVDYTLGAIITFIPVVRMEDFHVGHEERFGILELQMHARHGGEKFEIIFPADREREVSKAMEQVPRRLCEMVEVREILEPEIAARAALSATAEEIAELRAAIDTMDKNLEAVPPFIAADNKFHLTLAIATRNELIPPILESVVDLLNELRSHIFRVKGGTLRGQRHHKEILQAIVNRDPVAAREAMTKHLQQVRKDTDQGLLEQKGGEE